MVRNDIKIIIYSYVCSHFNIIVPDDGVKHRNIVQINKI